MVQVPGIIVTNGMLGDESLLLPRKRPLHGGELGVYWSDHQGPLAAGRLMASVVHGLMDLEDRLCSMQVAQMSIASPRRMNTISLDGELRTLRGPLRFESLSGVIQLLVPHSESTKWESEMQDESESKVMTGMSDVGEMKSPMKLEGM
jgi:diacylglycerol kinase family enzyme